MKRRRRPTLATRLRNLELAMLEVMQRLEELESGPATTELIGFAVPNRGGSEYESKEKV